MDILTLAPRTFLDDYDSSQSVRVRLVRDTDWCYYCADLRTGSYRNFAHFAWVLLRRERIDGYLKLRKEELKMAVSGQCDAKGCTREAFVRIRHVGTPFCDWQLLVCAKHEQAARERAVDHGLNCTEGGGARTCYVCERVIDYGEVYRRDEEDSTLWVHEDCLTDRSTDAKVVAAQSNLKGKRGMKDPVTKLPVKGKSKAAVQEEDDLPEDLEELEPSNGRAKSEDVDFEDDAEAGEEEDEEEDEAPKPKRATTRSATRPAASKNGKSAEKTPSKTRGKKAEPEKPPRSAKKADKASEKASTKYAEKAEKLLAKGEKQPRSGKGGEPFPDGDKAVMNLKRGKGGEIKIRLNSHVVAQWQAMEKNKTVISILGRSRYYFTIKNSDEAEALTASATKIAENKNTQKHLAAALTRAVENIDRWSKEIAKF